MSQNSEAKRKATAMFFCMVKKTKAANASSDQRRRQNAHTRPRTPPGARVYNVAKSVQKPSDLPYALISV